MTIHFHCGCGQKLKASGASVGKQFFCPLCGTKVTVPETDEAPVAETAAAIATAGKKARASGGSGAKDESGDEGPRDEAAYDDEDETNGASTGDTHEFQASDAIGSSAVLKKSPLDSDEPEVAESDTQIVAGGDTAVIDAVKDEEPTVAKRGPSPKEDRPAAKRGSNGSKASPKTNGSAAEAKRERRPEPVAPPEPERHDPDFRRHYESVTDESDAPGATAADTARDLYKLVKQMKKDGKTEAAERKAAAKERKKSGDGESLDMGALLSDLGKTVLPGAVGIVLVCALCYWLASTVMSASRNFPELGSVTGVVKLDGQPLQGATVTFTPVAEQGVDLSHVSSSVGVTDAQGRYELMYVADTAGAAVGKHTVSVSSMLPTGQERVPMKYNAGTTLAFEVKSGSNTADWDLVSPPAGKKK